MKLLKFLLVLVLVLVLENVKAGYLQPTVAYITDSQGNALVGTNVTIASWPPSGITGVSTNLIANVLISEVTGAGGFITNNLALGNYRLQISGFPRSIIFGVVSNGAAPINIAQVGSELVPLFMNFTLAQFSDAGTMAGQNTNNWTANSYVGVSNAVNFLMATQGGPIAVAQLPYMPATNGASVAYSQLPYTPPTNSFTGLTNALGFSPATNGGPIAVAQLPYAPATNNGSVAYSQLPYTPPTNSFTGLTNSLGFGPATNGGPIGNFQLSTNPLQSYGVLPNASMTTNYGLIWLVYQTNGLMGITLTNLPNGSICTTTNGQFFVLSNLTWLVK